VITKKWAKKVVRVPDVDTQVKGTTDIEEMDGKLTKQEENKLMNSVLTNDKETIDDGKLLKEALNQGVSSFTPDLMYEQLVHNYSITKKLLGPALIKRLTSYDPKYLERNVRIPEFHKILKEKLDENIAKLKDEGLVGKEGEITDKGVKLASLILYTEELDKMIPKGILGEKVHKKEFIYGEKGDVKTYKKGDRYRDIAVKRSAKLAIRRGHDKLHKSDLKIFERQSKGKISLIYALDASGSMKGKKLEVAKKAGIALAFKAIDEKDEVGLMVFGSDVKSSVAPTSDFSRLLLEITQIKASRETNIALTLKKAVELFPNRDITKHLILLTDALPTVGDKPEEETLEAVSLARSNGITISMIGINLDKKGKELGEKVARLGDGKFYVVRDLDEVDKVVLEDYYSVL